MKKCESVLKKRDVSSKIHWYSLRGSPGDQVMSFTANSIEGAAYIDKGWVEKVFRKAIEAEERVNLMRKSIKQKAWGRGG